MYSIFTTRHLYPPSILGSLSIIISVLWRRILCSPKVSCVSVFVLCHLHVVSSLLPQIHPIFVISVADCILGISWVIGGAFWLGKIEDRSWCYFPSLLNVVYPPSPPLPSSPLPLSSPTPSLFIPPSPPLCPPSLPRSLSPSLSSSFHLSSDIPMCLCQPDSCVCTNSL